MARAAVWRQQSSARRWRLADGTSGTVQKSARHSVADMPHRPPRQPVRPVGRLAAVAVAESCSAQASSWRSPALGERRIVRVTNALNCRRISECLFVLLALENWLLYHPKSHGRCWREPPPALHVEDVELTTPDGVAHPRLVDRPATGGRPTGPCSTATATPATSATAASTWPPGATRMEQAVLIFDYPGYGRSGGRPSEAGCYAAADAAYDWLTAGAAACPPSASWSSADPSAAAWPSTWPAAGRTGPWSWYSTFTSFPDLAQEKYPLAAGPLAGAQPLRQPGQDRRRPRPGVRRPRHAPTAWCHSTTAGGCSTPPRPPSTFCRCRASATRAGSVRISIFRWLNFLKIWRRADVRSVAAVK